MIQKLKKNNKGFTLVELIVVIAILGILTAVLVPQYIQYIEKSRVASDKNMAATLLSEVQTGIVQMGEAGTAVVAGEITVTDDSCAETGTGNISAILTSTDANWATARVKNKDHKDGVNAVYTITYSSAGATGLWSAT